MMGPTLVEACRPEYVVSCDIDPTEVTRVACDAQVLPFADRTFDVVVAFELMEHLPDTGSFLREVARVMKPGGRLVLSLPFLFGVHDHHDYYRFTAEGLDHVLRSNGLSMVAFERSGGIAYTVVTLLLEHLRTLGLPEARGWRSRGSGRRLHLAVSSVVTAPLALVGWLAFALDRLLDPRSRTPSGIVAIAAVDSAG